MNNTEKMVLKFRDEVIDHHNPDIEVKKKSQSLLYSIIKWIGKRFNPQFEHRFITHMFDTIWVPDDFFSRHPKSAVITMAHEYMHVSQRDKQQFLLHEFLYLFPQSLFLIAFPLLWMMFGFGWALLAAVFLAPCPAPFRYKKELEAYRIQLMIARLEGNEFSEAQWKEQIKHHMTTYEYYFCWPFKSKIDEDLPKPIELDDRHLRIIRFMEENNLIAKTTKPLTKV